MERTQNNNLQGFGNIVIFCFFLFFTILLSWPLFFNLDSYLLPSYLETIHSRGYIDTQAVVDRVNNT
ncbi:MAG: hypothetical protein KJ583_01960, partial [Nanoarchaeota archaeon]|nr:hypothetical protein [Nanoarchaeota archaeon]